MVGLNSSHFFVEYSLLLLSSIERPSNVWKFQPEQRKECSIQEENDIEHCSRRNQMVLEVFGKYSAKNSLFSSLFFTEKYPKNFTFLP